MHRIVPIYSYIRSPPKTCFVKETENVVKETAQLEPWDGQAAPLR